MLLWLLALTAVADANPGKSPSAGKRGSGTAGPGVERASQEQASSSSGPAYENEAEILWKDGKAAYDEGDFRRAVYRLRRLVDRYPAGSRYLEAHLLLGDSYLNSGAPGKAVAPLVYFVEALGTVEEADAGRFTLGRAYLALGRFREANLLASEFLKICRDRKNKTSATTRGAIEALLLKSESEMGLSHDDLAERALDAAKKELSDAKNVNTPRAQAAYVEQKLKLRSCARMPSAKSLTEDQIRNQLSRRGDCLTEATIPFRATITEGQEAWAALAASELSRAFSHYSEACQHPSLPPDKRTAKQLRAYQSELSVVLKEDCGSKRQKALDLIESWKAKAPPKTLSHVENVLRGLKGAKP